MGLQYRNRYGGKNRSDSVSRGIFKVQDQEITMIFTFSDTTQEYDKDIR